MKQLFFIILTCVISPLAQAIDCTSSYRSVDDRGELIEKTAPMEVVSDAGGVKNFESEIQDRLFFVVWFDVEQEFLMQIVNKADDHKGLTSRSGLDSKGSARLSEIDGSTVYSISCQN